LIVDQDAIATLVRIVDQFTFELPTGIDELRSTLIVSGTLFLSFRGGDAGQQLKLRIDVVRPVAGRLTAVNLPVEVSPGFGGFNIHADLKVGATNEGDYRFEIFLDNRFIVCVPFRVVHRLVAPVDPTPEHFEEPSA